MKYQNSSKIVPHKVNIVSFFGNNMKARKGISSVFMAFLLVASIFALPLAYAAHPDKSAVSVTEAQIKDETGLEVSASDFVVSSNGEPDAIVISITGSGENVKLSILEKRSVFSVNTEAGKNVITMTSYSGKISISDGNVYNVRGSSLDNLVLLKTGTSGSQGGSQSQGIPPTAIVPEIVGEQIFGTSGSSDTTVDEGSTGAATTSTGGSAVSATPRGDIAPVAPGEDIPLPSGKTSTGSRIVGSANLDITNKVLTITLTSGASKTYKLTEITRRPVRRADMAVASGGGAGVAIQEDSASSGNFLKRIFSRQKSTDVNEGVAITASQAGSRDTPVEYSKPSLFQRFKNFFFRNR